MEAAHVAFRPLVLESVRCLECGEVYAKPSAGGTVQKNPGCPSCGYVGWIPVSVPLEALHRSAADLPRVRHFRSR
jgi:predicted  nucleic acid-binding Zn-ribbon protein